MRTLPDKNSSNVDELLMLMPDKVKGALATCIETINNIRWKSVEFIIPDIPEPSHRPRLCGHRVYVPGAAKHQRFFQKKVLPKLNGLYIDTPCKITIDVYCQTPKSYTKTQKVLAEMKILRPWFNIGDVDNFAKTVMDSMMPNEKRHNVGILEDDSLVIGLNINKYYSMDPRYEVRIEYMGKIPDSVKGFLRL